MSRFAGDDGIDPHINIAKDKSYHSEKLVTNAWSRVCCARVMCTLRASLFLFVSSAFYELFVLD